MHPYWTPEGVLVARLYTEDVLKRELCGVASPGILQYSTNAI